MEGSSLQTLWLALAALAGSLIPVQAAVNTKMRFFAGQPLYSTLVNFGVGTVFLGLLLAGIPQTNDGGSWRRTLEAPWWAWTGGVLGVFFVTVSVLVVPKTGTAAFSIAMVAGQMFGALILDHYGVLGIDARAITPSRLMAVVLLVVALWLMQK
jgi:bacterial/archaeal transporter family-2 protein